jgi:hypothetical protein
MENISSPRARRSGCNALGSSPDSYRKFNGAHDRFSQASGTVKALSWLCHKASGSKRLVVVLLCRRWAEVEEVAVSGSEW